MISRDFTWDDDREHTDREESMAKACAKRWSEIHTELENESFRRQAAYEDGYGGDEHEPEPCETCGGDCYLGLDGPRTLRGNLVGVWLGCGEAQCPLTLVGIKCPAPNCEDGSDMGPIREAEQRKRDREAERDLEIEIIEAKLARMGARMMRPYEHWNEDERYMQYMEEGRYSGMEY